MANANHTKVAANASLIKAEIASHLMASANPTKVENASLLAELKIQHVRLIKEIIAGIGMRSLSQRVLRNRLRLLHRLMKTQLRVLSVVMRSVQSVLLIALSVQKEIAIPVIQIVRPLKVVRVLMQVPLSNHNIN